MTKSILDDATIRVGVNDFAVIVAAKKTIDGLRYAAWSSIPLHSLHRPAAADRMFGNALRYIERQFERIERGADL